MTALQLIRVVRGRLVIAAELMAGQIAKDEHYSFKVLKHTNEICTIQIYENRKELDDPVSYSVDDAKRAGIYKPDSGWVKNPRNMLFARAISNACRWRCPQILHGAYTFEEMGVEQDTSGRIIEGEIKVTPIDDKERKQEAKAEVPKPEPEKPKEVEKKPKEAKKEKPETKADDKVAEETPRDARIQIINDLMEKHGEALVKKAKGGLGIDGIKVVNLPEKDFQSFLANIDKLIIEKREAKK